MSKPTHLAATLLLASGLLSGGPLLAQQKPLPVPSATTTPHRTRLILKDGTYQIIMSYRIVGSVVYYVSAERGGQEEEIPVSLVDFDATKRWDQQHSAPDPNNPGPPEIDPELLKEEADRAALTPEVAQDLRLPEDDSTLVLDTYHGTPELVPLAQVDSDLNRNTAHNISRAAINPASSAHPIVQLRGISSMVQVHVPDPVLYIRIGDEVTGSTSGTPLTVDTHGAGGQGKPETPGGAPTSRYVIVRADVRSDARYIASFKISQLGSGHPPADVTETATQLLPGGHWMKITPSQPLEFGEYALMEVISDKSVNLSVWDFGVHPVSPENRDALKPEPKRPVTLERRRPD
jgi:hypothetical protein